MAIKTIIVLLVGLALASVHLADAQQPAKIPRIGYVSGTGDPPILGRTLRHSGKGCEISVILIKKHRD